MLNMAESCRVGSNVHCRLHNVSIDMNTYAGFRSIDRVVDDVEIGSEHKCNTVSVIRHFAESKDAKLLI